MNTVPNAAASLEEITMDEINRDVLIGHLSDLRVLEIAKTKFVQRINACNSRISQLGIHQTFHKPSNLGLGLAPVIAFGLLWLPVASAVMNKQSWVYILAAVAVVGSFLIALAVYSSKMKQYKQAVSQDEDRVNKEMIEKNALVAENQKNKAGLKEVNELLNNTYSINIIPQQYRNVGGICYLYDYLSTSQQSLESAFLNYNVEKVNMNINRVIENQSEMILQQYITNMKLKNIEGHNRQMIEQLRNIEQNSAMAAKYASITSANTSTMAFIETYNFLKDG